MLSITVESQLEYLFIRVAEQDALIAHYQARLGEYRARVDTLDKQAQFYAELITDALHGKDCEETYEQAFDRVMAILANVLR